MPPHTHTHTHTHTPRLSSFFSSIPIFIWGTLSFLFVVKLLLAIWVPITYDEVFTFFAQTQRSWLHNVSVYEAPNHHVLHSLLTKVSHHLPFGDRINLRVFPMVISTITTLLLYKLLSKHVRHSAAFLAMIIFGFLPQVVLYGWMSRGYYLHHFAMVIILFPLLEIFVAHQSEGFTKKQAAWFIVGNVIGLYAIPSFLYAFLSVSLFVFCWLLMKKSFRGLKWFFIAGGLTGVLTFLLYLPIFLQSGVSAIAGNEFTKPLNMINVIEKLPTHLSRVSDVFFGAPFGGFLFFLLVVFGISFIWGAKKHRVLMAFLGMQFLMVPIIVLLHKVVPFPRNWTYLLVPLAIVMGFFFETLIQRLKSLWLSVAIGLGVILLVLPQTYQQSVLHQDLAFDAKNLADFIINQEGETVYCNHPLSRWLILFRARERKVKNLKVIRSNGPQNSSDPKLATQDFDFLLFSKPVDPIPGYQPVPLPLKDMWAFERI